MTLGLGKVKAGWLAIVLGIAVVGGTGTLLWGFLNLERWRGPAVAPVDSSAVAMSAGVGALGRLEPATEVVQVAARLPWGCRGWTNCWYRKGIR
ncbi:MAG: DUF3754 domain-containing protein [Oscillatoriales cyanobacterium SM2_1_8]|nr:DUF3754 domain-containing protein [Oscillatoriales cyanobacterium SM2_1_8]